MNCPFDGEEHGLDADDPCPVCGVTGLATLEEIDEECVSPINAGKIDIGRASGLEEWKGGNGF